MIEDRLRAILHDAADEVPPYPRPERVLARARRRVAATAGMAVLVLAAATVSSVAVLDRLRPASTTRPADRFFHQTIDVEPSPGTTGVETPERDQAMVFAIRAVAGAGLFDPLGLFFSPTSIEQAGEGWRVGLAGAECGVWEGPRGRYETCKPFAGADSAGNGRENSWLGVELRGDRWRVTTIEGGFPEDMRDELAAFTLPQVDEDPHWEYPTPRLDEDAEPGLLSLRAASMWVGPIPYDGPGSRCQARGLDASGKVVFSEPPTYEDAPNEEWERAGGMRTTGIREHPDVVAVRIDCAPVTGAGWVPEEVVLEGQESASTQVIVHATLVWKDEPLVLAESYCTANVYAADGSLLGTSRNGTSAFWPPSEIEKPPPYRMDMTFTVRVDEPSDAARAEVTCKLP